MRTQEAAVSGSARTAGACWRNISNPNLVGFSSQTEGFDAKKTTTNKYMFSIGKQHQIWCAWSGALQERAGGNISEPTLVDFTSQN